MNLLKQSGILAGEVGRIELNRLSALKGFTVEGGGITYEGYV